MLNKIRAKISTPKASMAAYLVDHWMIWVFTNQHVVQVATHIVSKM